MNKKFDIKHFLLNLVTAPIVVGVVIWVMDISFRKKEENKQISQQDRIDLLTIKGDYLKESKFEEWRALHIQKSMYDSIILGQVVELQKQQLNKTMQILDTLKLVSRHQIIMSNKSYADN